MTTKLSKTEQTALFLAAKQCLRKLTPLTHTQIGPVELEAYKRAVIEEGKSASILATA